MIGKEGEEGLTQGDTMTNSEDTAKDISQEFFAGSWIELSGVVRPKVRLPWPAENGPDRLGFGTFKLFTNVDPNFIGFVGSDQKLATPEWASLDETAWAACWSMSKSSAPPSATKRKWF